MNRFVKQLLNRTQFRCETCPAVLAYDARDSHLNTCGVKINCIVPKCSHSSVDFATMGLLKQHWMAECLAIQVQCPACLTVVKRAEI